MSRARGVSAVAFAVAAAVVAWLFMVAVLDGERSWWTFLVYPLPLVIPGAVAGATLGPRLARSQGAWTAVGLGAVATVVAVLLFTVLVSVAMVVAWPTSMPTLSTLTGAEFGWAMVYAVAIGLVLSPVGMIAGWAAWVSLGRGDQHDLSP